MLYLVYICKEKILKSFSEILFIKSFYKKSIKINKKVLSSNINTFNVKDNLINTCINGCAATVNPDYNVQRTCKPNICHFLKHVLFNEYFIKHRTSPEIE